MVPPLTNAAVVVLAYDTLVVLEAVTRTLLAL